MKPFNISKRALIQLPPEAKTMWDWVKIIYARRVLYNYMSNLISIPEAKSMAQKEYKKSNYIINLLPEVKNLKSFKEEKEFVKIHNLYSIPYYDITKSANQFISLTTKRNDNGQSNMSVWTVSPFNENTLYNSLENISKLLVEFYNELKNAGLKDEELIERTMLKQQVIKDSKNGQPIKKLQIEVNVPLKTDKWNIYNLNKYNIPQNISLVFQEISGEGVKGEWEEDSSVISLYLFYDETYPISLNEYAENQNELKRVLFHEIRHMIQSFIGIAKNTHAGLPKIMDPHYDAFGFTPYSIDRQDHTLRNVEYHTRLPDAITEFNQIKNKFPKQQQIEAL